MLTKFVILSFLSLFGRAFADSPRVICYYSSWAIYRPGTGQYSVGDIDPTLCTHVVYSFIGLATTGDVQFLDPWNDIGDASHQGQIQQMLLLKKVNPDLKLLLAIGGYNHGPQNFQEVVRKPVKRAIFVQSAFDTLTKYSFDGLDIDWEYQDSVGGTAEDKTGLSDLLKEMRAKFNEANLTLSIATSANFNLIDNCYELDKISASVDFINIMAYDFHGAWESVTGHVTPLHAPSTGSQQLSVEAVLNYYIDNGADPSKLNLGLITYGRSFTLSDPNKHDLGAPTKGPGQLGPIVPEGGVLAYGDICKNKWTEVFVDEQAVPYAYSGDQWVGYDNPKSAGLKIDFANTLGVKGVMVWSLETDDKTGDCTGETYPLLRSIYNKVTA